jgi:hypothetical protein
MTCVGACSNFHSLIHRQRTWMMMLLVAALGVACDAPVREEPLVPRWSVVRDARAGETWLALDLGARYQPFVAVELDVADDRFFREVRVEARRQPRTTGADAVGGGRPGPFIEWSEGSRREVSVLAAGRARLRVRVRDQRPPSPAPRRHGARARRAPCSWRPSPDAIA